MYICGSFSKLVNQHRTKPNQMPPVEIEDLKKVIALMDLPDEHLHWILAHSEYQEYKDGDMIAKFGDPADIMWIGLSGKVNFYMAINGMQVYYFTFENNNVTGGIGGIMPYSRMKTHPGYSYASGEVKLLRMHKKHFAELEHLNPDFIQKLIGYMTERARIFATTQQHHEKVNALGILAAGIAHELNNPAAAINRIASTLTEKLHLNYTLTKNLLECNMTPLHIDSIRSLVAKKEAGLDKLAKRTSLQKLESEETITDWLEHHSITAREVAETFSEYGFSTRDLDEIYSEVGAASFPQVIPWLENLLSSQKIIADLADASNRISLLVGSIKSHVHMDRTNELQPTNVHQDIENTLTLLGFKLREKNITVQKDFCRDLPDIPAFVGELNQVWTNLIDNAIFAVEKNGTIIIKTACSPKQVTVQIIDNGNGIPKENLSRIFDPFFTTKKVGEGTGIGLDIVNRVVKSHNGEITVHSTAGRTEFIVSIPTRQ